jgi:hypothetical protein
MNVSILRTTPELVNYSEMNYAYTSIVHFLLYFFIFVSFFMSNNIVLT